MPIFGSFAASGLASKLLSAAKAAMVKMFISKSNSGYYTTTDATANTWTLVSNTQTPRRVYEYAYGNGVYVILGGSGYNGSSPYAMYAVSPTGSVDNLTWNTISALESSWAENITFIPELGKFIVRGGPSGGSAIYVSTDGITWSQYSSAVGGGSDYGPVNTVYVGGKVYIPITNSRIMDTSTDGITWTASATKSGPSFYSPPVGIGYFNGYFWAVDPNDTYNGMPMPYGYIRYSTDLVTWSQGSLPTMVLQNYYGGTIQVLGSRIIVGGQSSINTSANGTTWTTVSMPNGNSMNSSIAYGNSRWAVVVTSNMGQEYYVNYSTNATSFTQGTNIGSGGAVSYGNDSAGSPIKPGWNSLVYGTAFVISGQYQDSGDYNSYTCTMRSTDAITWTNFVKHNANTNAYSGLAYAGSSHVMVSNGSGDPTKAIAASTNGIAWTYSAHPDSGSDSYVKATTLASANNTFLLSGNSSPGNLMYYSTNGTTWSSTNMQKTGYWPIWTYGASKYVTYDSNSTDVTASTDLVTWGGTIYTGAAVDRSNGGMAAYGPTAALVAGYRSTNGVTWGAVSGSPASDFNGFMIYGNNIYMHMQTYGTVSISTDGLTWNQYSGPSSYLTKPKLIDGKFYVHDTYSGQSGYYSTNGATWTSFAMPSGYFLNAPFVGKP